jgi:DNA mismatch endonuclease (patch repair protein)
MADVHDVATRSRNMAAIRGRDTRPERVIRSALHRQGYRFRLHSASVPGRPDLVLPKYRAAIFVHGCFWHGHECRLFRWPATRKAFWREKILGNRRRDRLVRKQVLAAGWRHVTVWECALRGGGEDRIDAATARVARWVRSRRSGQLEIPG